MSRHLTPITSIYDALPDDSQVSNPIGFSSAETPIRFVHCDICGEDICISSFEEHKQTHRIRTPKVNQYIGYNFPKESVFFPQQQCLYSKRHDYILESLKKI